MDVLPLLPAFLTFPHIEGIFCSVPQKCMRNTSSSSPWPSSLPRGGREPVLSCLGWELSMLGHQPDAHCFLIHLAHRRMPSASSCRALPGSDSCWMRRPYSSRRVRDWGSGPYIMSDIRRPIVTTHMNYSLPSSGVSGEADVFHTICLTSVLSLSWFQIWEWIKGV